MRTIGVDFASGFRGATICVAARRTALPRQSQRVVILNLNAKQRRCRRGLAEKKSGSQLRDWEQKMSQARTTSAESSESGLVLANMIDDDRNDPACDEQRDDRVTEQAEVAVEIRHEVPERARKLEVVR
jgi:hypothetical protein